MNARPPLRAARGSAWLRSGKRIELYFRLYPQHYRALQLVRIACQLTNAPRARDGGLQRCESRVVGLLSDVMHDGVRCGDLVLPEPRYADEIAFMVWALAFGTRALMNTAVAASQLGISDSYRVLRRSADLWFDALGWRPLTCEWDYERVRWRVHTELFADEWHAAFAA